eukprot:TRINITY_DN2704_c0_g1_i10.p1 TRINITY_DN2704_c0_g1~~TRINITY_DN2704_c0_g1_i10.p1  ORF type:complete len:253 (-),score=38.73 TRINITY_DN2704_c0_g1_i10:251-1009(-)
MLCRVRSQFYRFQNHLPVSPNLIRTMSVDIGGMRKPYNDKENTFDVKDLVSKDPFDQFKVWFDEATANDKIEEANAMCLATASKDGFPSARMVLLKKYGPEGFTFYTNYTSRKGGELDSNPRAALVFYWEPLKRSIRVEGNVERVPMEESKAYFHSRPISSQIGAWVSDQSKVINDRSVLTDKEAELTAKHQEGGEPMPFPTHWGGYRVVPRSIEFWQGQSNRIHDRIKFRIPEEGESTAEDSKWVLERLAP